MSYKMLQRLGGGAYGITYKVCDENGKVFTIKFFMLQSAPDKGVYGHLNLREIDFLVKSKHPNINSVHQVLTTLPFLVKPEQGKTLDKYCVVYPFAEYDLEHYISHCQKRRVAQITYQLLLAIDYLHSHSIMHRDIKPGNVLYYSDGTIKLADFGLAKHFYQINKRNSRDVGTLQYMAPEVIGDNQEYDYNAKMDIWACGCVILKLIKGKEFFELSERNDMFETILKKFELKYKMNAYTYEEIIKQGNKKVVGDIISLNKEELEMIGGEKTLFLKLINGMMNINPSKRFSVRECLDHPFFIALKYSLPMSVMSLAPIFDKSSHQKRDIIIKKVFWNFIEKREESKIDFRILFQGLRIFDLVSKNKLICDLEDIDIIGYISFYIAYKYFNGEQVSSIYKLFPEISFQVSMLETLEKHIIEEILLFRIYETTIYEALPCARLGGKYIRQLFTFVTSKESDRLVGLSVSRLAKFYKEESEEMEERQEKKKKNKEEE